MIRPLKLASLFALALAACAHEKPRPDVYWPPPPEKPRIKFVRAFSKTPDLDNSFGRKLVDLFKGGNKDPKLQEPMGLAISADGRRLYIADEQWSSVLVADFDAKTLKPLAPEVGGAAPIGVALDADENVYAIAGKPAGVTVYDRTGRLIRAFGEKDLKRPTGVAVDPKRKLLYVTDSSPAKKDPHRVVVYSLEGKLLRTIGGERGDKDGEFNYPSYLAVDADGNLFVADSLNFRIQVFDPTGKFVRKFGENGDGPGEFSRLKGIAFDGFGNLYAVDKAHANVQIFNHDFRLLMWFAGNAHMLEYLEMPTGIAIDPRANLIYVAEDNLARVNVYQLVNTTAADSTGAAK